MTWLWCFSCPTMTKWVVKIKNKIKAWKSKDKADTFCFLVVYKY